MFGGPARVVWDGAADIASKVIHRATNQCGTSVRQTDRDSMDTGSASYMALHNKGGILLHW